MGTDDDRNVVNLNWTDDQWNSVLKAVTDEAQRARVAASFLPLFGPVDAVTIGIPSFELTTEAANGRLGAPSERLKVDSFPKVHLLRLSTLVYLRSHEIADPDLTAALGKFRRSANVIARVEDDIIFNGYSGNPGTPPHPNADLLKLVKISEHKSKGLLPYPHPAKPPPPGAGQPRLIRLQQPAKATALGDSLFPKIVEAINQLEEHGHFGPFACALSTNLYQAICTPNTQNNILPRDRILPFLDGQLFRSGTIPADFGVVIALGGAPLELVVASDIGVRLLQASLEPRWVFRVSERIALRIKEPESIAVLHVHP